MNQYRLLIWLPVLFLCLLVGCSNGEKVQQKQTTDNPCDAFGAVKSAAGAKMLTPIVLRGTQGAKGHLFFEMPSLMDEDVTVTLQLDPKVLEAYNTLNGTGLVMYPVDKIVLENEGKVLVEKVSINHQPWHLISIPEGEKVQRMLLRFRP